MKRSLLIVLFALLSVLVPSIQAQQSPQSQFLSEEKPAKEAALPPTETATICFYRPRRFQGSALKPSIYVDDSQVARLKNGETVNITIPAGQHRVYSNDKATGIDLDVKAGQTYYVRLDIQTGMWKGHGGITLVDAQEGKYESSKTKSEAAVDLSTASK